MLTRAASDRANDPLVAERRRSNYNEAERWFSRILQQRLDDLLQAKRNHLEILRRYPGQPDRLGVMGTPARLPRDQLRLPVVEELAWRAIDFVRADGVGGPVSQLVCPDGAIIELQAFPTKYPHIVIERSDRYVGDDPNPTETTWCLRRVQNQRQQTQFNRILDAASLVFDLIRVIA